MSDSDSTNEDNYKERRRMRIEINTAILENLHKQRWIFDFRYEHTLKEYEKKKNNKYVKKSKLIKRFLDIKLPIESKKGRESLADKYRNYANLCHKVDLLLMNYQVDLI